MISPDDYRTIVIRLIEGGLSWDLSKCLVWMVTSNPNFGGADPSTLISMGRGEKVLKFVISALEENNPPSSKIEIDPK
jgi:hypothetical protein